MSVFKAAFCTLCFSFCGELFPNVRNAAGCTDRQIPREAGIQMVEINSNRLYILQLNKNIITFLSHDDHYKVK